MPSKYVAVRGASDATASQLESPLPAKRRTKAKMPASPSPRLKKRVVPKADGRYLIYYDKP